MILLNLFGNIKNMFFRCSVLYIHYMAFIRRFKKGDSINLALVESYREGGKVNQRVIEYRGKE